MDAPQIAGDKSGGRMITLTREEAQQVLDALEAEHRWLESLNTGKTMRAIETLRAKFAQPEPEPVAWYYAGSDIEWHSIALNADLDDAQKANCTPLYTAPPQRNWQGLTDEEIGMLTVFDGLHHVEVPLLAKFTRAIEAKLKEKNG